MATRQYIGARYVPIVDGVWDNTKVYEPLTIVSYPDVNGATYTSRRYVPLGIAPTNNEYWALTGTYNAQISVIQNQVNALETEVDILKTLPTLKDKKILVVGDSISSPTTSSPCWVDELTTLVTSVGGEVKNISVDGQHLTGLMVNPTILTSEPDNYYDIIIMAVGTNDCNSQVQIGNAQTSQTFVWSLNELNTILTTKWLSAEVFYITPLKNVLSPVTTPKPVKLNAYISAITKYCNKYNWNIIDGNSGMPRFAPANANFKNAFLIDDIHPNPAYAPIFAKYVLRNLLSGGVTAVGITKEITTISTFTSSAVTSGYVNISYYSNGDFAIDMGINLDGTTTGFIDICDLPSIITESPYMFGIDNSHNKMLLVRVNQGQNVLSVYIPESGVANVGFHLDGKYNIE